MKKLTLNKNKVITCLVLLCLILVQCSKDSINTLDLESKIQKQQKISEATIVKWMETNLAAQALSLDWKNARKM